jgi:hypothetical protein
MIPEPDRGMMALKAEVKALKRQVKVLEDNYTNLVDILSDLFGKKSLVKISFPKRTSIGMINLEDDETFTDERKAWVFKDTIELKEKLHSFKSQRGGNK